MSCGGTAWNGSATVADGLRCLWKLWAGCAQVRRCGGSSWHRWWWDENIWNLDDHIWWIYIYIYVFHIRNRDLPGKMILQRIRVFFGMGISRIRVPLAVQKVLDGLSFWEFWTCTTHQIHAMDASVFLLLKRSAKKKKKEKKNKKINKIYWDEQYQQWEKQ